MRKPCPTCKKIIPLDYPAKHLFHAPLSKIQAKVTPTIKKKKNT